MGLLKVKVGEGTEGSDEGDVGPLDALFTSASVKRAVDPSTEAINANYKEFRHGNLNLKSEDTSPSFAFLANTNANANT
jgi:hypothetical protein